MTDNNWIEWKWTPEKPYPETLETKVHVIFNTGHDDIDMDPSPVSYWGWNDQYMRIVKYRVWED